MVRGRVCPKDSRSYTSEAVVGTKEAGKGNRKKRSGKRKQQNK